MAEDTPLAGAEGSGGVFEGVIDGLKGGSGGAYEQRRGVEAGGAERGLDRSDTKI